MTKFMKSLFSGLMYVEIFAYNSLGYYLPKQKPLSAYISCNEIGQLCNELGMLGHAIGTSPVQA